MRLNIAPVSVECPQQAFAASIAKSLFGSFSSMKERKRNRSLVCQIVLYSPFKSRKFLKSQTLKIFSSKVDTVKRTCSANIDESSTEEVTEGLAESFDPSDDEEINEEPLNTKGCCTVDETNPSPSKEGEQMFSENSIFESQIDILEPSLLGICPEPPDWPERESVLWASIEQKVKSLDLPMSLRMIKKKRQQLQRMQVLGESAYSSVRKAFSSMVFIIVELQSYALQMRETICNEDLEMIIAKVQKDMHSSFAWLFHQVFSRTPTLMIYVMILLANFSVYSASNNVAIAQASALSAICETTVEMPSVQHSQNDHLSVTSVTVSDNNKGGREANLVADGGNSSNISESTWYTNLSAKEVLQDGHQRFRSVAEVSLWNSMLYEAAKIQEGQGYLILDHDVLQRFVSPFSVELERDDYLEYTRTDVLYQMGLSREPNNQLLLCNYARFLQLVAHDHNRAEECFKRAIQVEPPDAECLSQYADFLWTIRKDLWGAEERYLQALSSDPENPYHASKYATFLYSTGGEETCFPLNASNNNTNSSN